MLFIGFSLLINKRKIQYIPYSSRYFRVRGLRTNGPRGSVCVPGRQAPGDAAGVVVRRNQIEITAAETEHVLRPSRGNGRRREGCAKTLNDSN